MSRFKKNGIALATLLLILPLILILIAALLTSLQSGNRWTGSTKAQTTCAYIAEAGAAHAVETLETDSSWTTGFPDVPMANGQGTYNVTFNQTKTNFQKNESVNNADGDHADSFLGPDTVPNGAALVVVTSNLGSFAHRAVFLVGTGDSTIRVKQGLLTSGKIVLEGETSLTAIKSLSEKGDVKAKVHSNDDSSASDLISWQPGANGGTILIDGEVSSSGTSSTAIDLPAGAATDGSTTGANQVAIPPAGIEATVFGKRSASNFAGGNNVPTGDNYYDATSNPLVVNGDLLLNGDLYVEGDLEIVGSIRGEGSVYTTGDTKLLGDSEISAKANVSLYSKGNVTLDGFDGDQYLDNIAATDPRFDDLLSETRQALTIIETEMNNGNWTGATGNLSPVNRHIAVIGRARNLQLPPGFNHNDTLSQMRNHILSTSPPGKTTEFMTDKLRFLDELFTVSAELVPQTSDEQIQEDFFRNGDTRGLVDAANDLDHPELMAAAFNLTEQLNYQKIGSSSFQGLIYTNGGFYADNQVTILGAVVVNDDGSQSAFTTADGETINPGELHLKGGSNITYVEEYFDGTASSGNAGPTRILLHLGDG